MVDAEWLMRLRGLAKREVSRKSRLLHHMYTWVRIVCESTYVLHDYAAFIERLQLRRRTHGKPEHHKHAAAAENKLDDFLRFEPHSEESEQESSKHGAEEAQETALRDIHLQDPRENPNTLYGMIYGISETWLRLLSQTTRLANQMDAIKATEDMAVPGSLLRKAAQIEDIVCTLASTSSASPANALPNMHLHKALNSALVIFFYRRIRNVNPWILQSHVDDIIRALASYDQALTRQKVDGPGLVWPAFMAACEAIITTKRNHLMRWIEQASAKTGIHYYGQAKEIIEEVWRRRDASSVQTDDSNRYNRAKASTQSPMSTWMDILREKKIWLMAC
jgi:arginine metabolism regulation protein II